MTEESAAVRLEHYREAWREALGVENSEFPDRQRMEQVWSWSDYVAQACLRDPQLLSDLHTDGLLDRCRANGEMADALATLLAAVDDEAGLEAVLRRFRRREMVRIIWRDLSGIADLDETLEELSELADICIRQALDRLYDWAVAKSGVPRNAHGEPQQLIVLGMGKLGARELNLSSDIDLIYCFPEHGHTDGRREIENERFFTRIGRQLANLLSRQDTSTAARCPPCAGFASAWCRLPACQRSKALSAEAPYRRSWPPHHD